MNRLSRILGHLSGRQRIFRRRFVIAVDLQRCAAGPAHSFGERFWATLEAEIPDLLAAGPLLRVVYRDRYLQCPGALAGLYSVLAHLESRRLLGPRTRIRVIALQSASQRPPRSLRSNWPQETDQRAVLESLLMALRGQVEVELLPDYDRRKIPHFRSMELEFVAGAVEIRLDQGFGFLEASPRDDRFPFELGIDKQVSKLLGGSWTWVLPTARLEVPAYVMTG